MTTICITRECFEDICDLLEVCDEICYFTNEQGKKMVEFEGNAEEIDVICERWGWKKN